MSRPIAVDLFCGLGGWSEGLLAENWRVIGFDIERHIYGEHRYPAQLVVQDVLTLHGSQFRSADLIVASPPCQEYSYMAMPWGRAKQIAAALRGDGEFPPGYTGSRTVADLTRLFDACFRIQREACDAAGRHIPMVVENVKGAQPWVGPARWSFGSFFLWGDVPALMPSGFRGFKSRGMDWSDRSKRGQDFTRVAGEQAIKNSDRSWLNIGSPGQKETGRNPVHALSGVKHSASGAAWFDTGPSSLPSSSPRRKFASAMIAKIPEPLSRHIARTFRPIEAGKAAA